jgi:drug/metabolite transporter (DMT)-like permease
MASLFFLIPSISCNPTISNFFLGLLAGILIQSAQALYFKALSYSEAGIVSAYWNIVPALLPVASYFLFHEIFGVKTYLGIILLILASTWMCYLDYKSLTRFRSLFLMIASSSIMVCVFLLESFIYKHISFILGFNIIIFGFVMSGSILLLSKQIRNTFRKSMYKIYPARKLFLIIEILNLIALICSQLAISFGDPSLVSAVQTTIPAYAFIISILLFYFTNQIGSFRALKNLHWKILNVVLMMIGVILLSN